MKQFKHFLLTVAMLLCNTFIFAHNFAVDGIYYTITSEEDLTVKVSYKGSSYDDYLNEYYGSVTIPESVTYNGITYSVTSIGNSAFKGCSGLTSVTIGNSVTSIGESAFSGCHYLTSVTIGNSVTSIGNDAFRNCSGLTSVHISDIAAWYKIDFGNENSNPLYYAEHLFLGGEEIKDLVIPNSVTSIGSYAFSGCSSLTSVTIPNSVTSIGDYAFYDCDGLTSVEIPNSVTSIGSYAFCGCDGLTSIEIPNSVTSIGESTFLNCDGLTSVTIGNSVTSIGEGAFDGCSLKSLTIGAGVLSIGSDQSKPVKTIWLTNTPPSGYKNLQGNINYVANDQYSGLSNVEIYPYLSSAFETDGVKYVPVSPAERTCDAIDCSYDSTVVDINIGETVSFKGVEMKVQNVMPYTAHEHKFVKGIKVSSKGDIGNYAFYGCTALKTANVENKGVISSEAFRGCTALETLTLGENVTSIGGSAFRDCSKLLAVTIPNKTTSLGTYSFAGCTLLKQLDLGNGVQSIGEYSFNGCSALPSIDIPASVTSVGDYTFKGCTSLADVVIKDRTTDLSLGSNGSSPLFADCPLDYVYIGGNISYSTSSSYGYSPFYRNTSLRSVVITDKEEEISDNEFYGCTNLKNVSIGCNVKKIGNWAFSGCSSLDYFSFGKSVESIGEEAFSDCVNMTQLISHAATPPTCGTQALDDINKWNCTLKIPEGTNSAYMAANQWKEFFFIENVLEGLGYQVTFVVDGETVATDSVKLGSTIDLPEPPVKEGYTFTGWENVPETMPANDITINGSFKINSYAVKYVVDGVDYATDSVEYGAVVTLIDGLEKEGYSFSWSEAPETMPANDITITGEWSINSYLVTFIVDGAIYATDSVEYGAAITLPEVPEKDNSTFEWEEAPETMPASDVTIYGNYVSGIGGVTVSGKADVYTLNGMLYKRDVDLNNLGIELPKGVYIINGKKIMVK